MPANQGLTGYIIRTRQPLLIKEDVQNMVEQLGLENVGANSQSYLGAPITMGDQVLGVIAIQSYTTARVYNEHDQNLLVAIAGQTAIALQNARLFEETRQRNAELATLNQIISSASETLDLRALFARQLSFHGSYMGSMGELDEVLKHIFAGKLKPVVDKVFPLGETRAAHEYLGGREQFGKVVVTP